MSEMDLSGLSSLLLTAYGESVGSPSEEDPTERMMEFAERRRAGNTADDVANGESSEQQERARDGADTEDLREPDHDGDMETEEFDVSEALSRV